MSTPPPAPVEPPPSSAAPAPASPVRTPHIEAAPAARVRRIWRVLIFYSLAVLLTGCGALLFADLLWRVGWSTSRTILLGLFSILFLLASIGCMHGVYGFILRRIGERRRLTQLGDYQAQPIAGVSTALVFPIYNEEVRRVSEGVRTAYESVQRTGHLERFDFFILSDSTDLKKWVEEEHHWFALVRDLKALGRIFYRRRLINEAKKSGNIRDFLNNWGTRYRYFIVFDADSIMSGQTVVDLVKLMELHPTVGMIQTAPGLVNARSAFGRLQQFASRLYGPIYTAGLNFWAQDGGNYWGHNAIIRTEPFMQHCDLPHLPGNKPFGGQILSHDFVEAALLRMANWEVWIAADLDGSYEEGPPSIIDNAQRDRRWCQGNLQHFMVLFARGLRGISRVHLSLGILGYLSGPLWFLFLLTGTYVLWYKQQTGLSEIMVEPFTPFLKLEGAEHALLIFCLTLGVLFLPKVLSLIDLLLLPARRVAFGGFRNACGSAFIETLFSTLHAPVQMLYHTKFVAAALFGISVHWGPQRRAADGTPWIAALQQHWGHTLLGVGWGILTWRLDPKAFWWFVPVLSGMVFSIPLSVFTSRERLGLAMKRMGLCLTPEETQPPAELVRLEERLAVAPAQETVLNQPALQEVVLDPYTNALHVSLLREKQLNPNYAQLLHSLGVGTDRMRELAAQLLSEGPGALSTADEKSVLSDAETLSWLHFEAWRRPAEELHDWWREAIARYNR